MSRLRLLVVAGILLSCTIPSTSHAFAISGGGAFWNNGWGNGAGLMLYPQFYIAMGITPELQLGAEFAKNTITTSTSVIPGTSTSSTNTAWAIYVPAMVGIRFDFSKVLPLGPIAPFVAAHVGYAGLFKVTTGASDSLNNNSNNLGYNVYAGTAFWIADTVGLGVEGGVDVVNNTLTNAATATYGNEIIGCARAILQLR